MALARLFSLICRFGKRPAAPRAVFVLVGFGLYRKSIRGNQTVKITSFGSFLGFDFLFKLRDMKINRYLNHPSFYSVAESHKYNKLAKQSSPPLEQIITTITPALFGGVRERDSIRSAFWVVEEQS